MHVDIDELVLRVPGLDPATAREVGGRVAAILGERLAVRPPARTELGALDLRLTVSPGSIDRLVDQIAGAILERLG